MEIKGKAHCLFEQSGTFKNQFKKLGFDSYDYDIQNNFNETDFVVDLFAEIEKAYEDKESIFDNIGKDDFIMAFFPCIHFCDAKIMAFKAYSIYMKKWSMQKIMDNNIKLEETRTHFFTLLMKLVSLCCRRGLRLVIENPWNDSGMTYLQNNFPDPQIIDMNRSLRGDHFVKPTAYWFFNCEPTNGFTYQKNKRVKIVYREHGEKQVTGQCDEQRSLISPDYARNFICDFILGKAQPEICKTLFD